MNNTKAFVVSSLLAISMAAPVRADHASGCQDQLAACLAGANSAATYWMSLCYINWFTTYQDCEAGFNNIYTQRAEICDASYDYCTAQGH